ncbi:hypothetical protein PUN28_013182 [Cardiocondyla obscurior]|uniref:Uncharacterized protein n=1 Tax=Cardiocondyla obscurior TaxID=286306 RepID=A0AAW2F9D8_9HYME
MGFYNFIKHMSIWSQPLRLLPEKTSLATVSSRTKRVYISRSNFCAAEKYQEKCGLSLPSRLHVRSSMSNPRFRIALQTQEGKKRERNRSRPLPSSRGTASTSRERMIKQLRCFMLGSMYRARPFKSV